MDRRDVDRREGYSRLGALQDLEDMTASLSAAGFPNMASRNTASISSLRKHRDMCGGRMCLVFASTLQAVVLVAFSRHSLPSSQTLVACIKVSMSLYAHVTYRWGHSLPILLNTIAVPVAATIPPPSPVVPQVLFPPRPPPPHLPGYWITSPR